jgi:hypothetical protein
MVRHLRVIGAVLVVAGAFGLAAAVSPPAQSSVSKQFTVMAAARLDPAGPDRFPLPRHDHPFRAELACAT